jgi:hypothetical protein
VGWVRSLKCLVSILMAETIRHFLFDRDAWVYFDQSSVTTKSNATDYGTQRQSKIHITKAKAERWLIQKVMRKMS